MSVSAAERRESDAHRGGADSGGRAHLCVYGVDVFRQVCGESEGGQEGTEEEDGRGVGV